MRRLLVPVLVGMLAGGLLMSAIPSGAHPGGDRKLQRQINKLKNQVSVLQDKTQDMDRDGFYNSLVLEGQVVSFQLCEPLEDAVWLDTEVVPDLTYLACNPEPGTQATRAQLEGFKKFQR